MTLVPVLLALGIIAGPAHAGKKKSDDVGVRLKVSSDLFTVNTIKTEYDGSPVDDAESRYTTVSLFESSPRLEATYLMGSGLEVGGMLGFTQVRGTVGGNEDPTDRHTFLALTGAYNMNLTKGVRGYAQPILGIDTSTVDVGEPNEIQSRFLFAGVDVGTRFKLNKNISFDTALEGAYGKGKVSVDGESDDKLALKNTKMGLRIGLSMRI